LLSEKTVHNGFLLPERRGSLLFKPFESEDVMFALSTLKIFVTGGHHQTIQPLKMSGDIKKRDEAGF